MTSPMFVDHAGALCRTVASISTIDRFRQNRTLFCADGNDRGRSEAAMYVKSANGYFRSSPPNNRHSRPPFSACLLKVNRTDRLHTPHGRHPSSCDGCPITDIGKRATVDRVWDFRDGRLREQ